MPPSDGSRATVLQWAVDTAADYVECAARHRALTEAVR